MLLAAVIGFATVGSSIGLLMASAWLVSGAALHPAISSLRQGIAGVRTFGLARGPLRYAERLVSHDTTFRILTRLRVWFYEALEPLAPARLAGYRSADLLQRIVDDIQGMENIFSRVIAPPMTALMVTLLMWFLIGAWSVSAAVGVLACQLLAGLVVPLMTAGMARGTARSVMECRTEQQLLAVDLVQGLGELRIFGALDGHLAGLRAAEDRKLELQEKASFIEGLHDTLSGLCMNAAVVWVLWVLLPEVRAGSVSAITLSALIFGVTASFEAFLPLSGAMQHLEADIRAGGRLFEIIDAEPEVVAPATPEPLPDMNGIELRALGFTYPGSSRPALDDITFQVPQGRRVAIVGPSGAGKSTIASLLVRFWNPTRGTITIGGTELSRLDPEALRGRIAVVSQNTYLFGQTVRENLLIARPEATDGELKRALAAAGLESLHGRLDDWAGQHGMNLSGGERQRMAIARMILQDAPVILLDEATANLDAITEEAVLDTIERMSESRTVLAVTHHLNRMERYDDIVVLNEGKIVEQGRHAGLLERNGFYAAMWRLQHETEV
jgi:ATP-binding cassette subfamily C protein CydC